MMQRQLVAYAAGHEQTGDARMRRLVAVAVLLYSARAAHGQRPLGALTRLASPERIAANDNRAPAGTLQNGVLTLHLVAREGRWFPGSDSGSSTVVQAFAEEGHALQIPGPLVRGPVRWRAVAKDRADLPPHQATERAARLPMQPGETADFTYTPTAPGDLVLDVTTQTPGWSIRVPVRVTAPAHPR